MATSKNGHGRVVILDMDGVLFARQLAMTDALYLHTGYRFTLDRWTEWDSILRDALVNTEFSQDELMEICFGNETMISAVPFEEAQRAVKLLVNHGVTPIVVSGRPLAQRELSVTALAKAFPEISPAHVFLRHDGVNRDLQKVAAAVQFSAVSLADDSAETVSLAERMLGADVLALGMPDWPWNQHIKATGRIVRMGDWVHSRIDWDILLGKILPGGNV